MKGKKEGGEIKGREGRKRGKGEKERGKKKRRERKKTPEFHSRARTRDLPLCSQPPMATAWRVDSHVRTIHVYIAKFDFDCGCARSANYFAAYFLLCVLFRIVLNVKYCSGVQGNYSILFCAI